LVSTVTKSLAKAPADRYQSAEELGTELTKEQVTIVGPAIVVKRGLHAPLILTLSVVVLVLAVLLIVWFQSSRPDSSAADRPMLAVLPFANLGSPDDEYVADGIADAIRTQLSGLAGLDVIGRASAVQYKNTDKTLQQIGDELTAGYVLNGTVQRERPSDPASRVRITPELIDVFSGRQLWASAFDVDLIDVFDVYAEIGERVVEALDLVLLAPDRQPTQYELTDNAEAYDLYLRGLGFWLTRLGYPEREAEARELFRGATQLDPRMAVAYGMLAQAAAWEVFERGRSGFLDSATAAITTALELAPELPDVRLSEGVYYYFAHRDYERALEALNIALEKQPSNAYALVMVGAIQRRQGRWNEALRTLERAIQLDPMDVLTVHTLARGVYARVRDYPKAVNAFERVVSLAPNQGAYYRQYIQALLSSGDTARARQVFRTARDRPGFSGPTWSPSLRILAPEWLRVHQELSAESFPGGAAYYYVDKAELLTQVNGSDIAATYWDSSRVELERIVDQPVPPWGQAGNLGRVYARLGLPEQAMELGRRATELMPMSRDAVEAPYMLGNLAEIFALVGEQDSAVAHLERVLEIPSAYSVPLLRLDPLWDPLRSHPGFQALLEKYEN
jgi:TolB-like protein/cytochrome c-type biogenesis protein CcmH/NrfG